MANEWALVTGASSGIGYWLARELANRGYSVIACAEDEGIESAASKMESNGGQVTVVQADLATRGGVEKLWREVEFLSPYSYAIAFFGVGVLGGHVTGREDVRQEKHFLVR